MKSTPAISVVIGSAVPPSSLAACLAALAPQLDGAEVLVVEARPSPPELRMRFPWARFLLRPGKLVPELWRDGIDHSRGVIVALTLGCMEPAPDWIATVRAQHAHRDVIAGAIEPGTALRLCDWAEYFCRYAPDMLPFAGHVCSDLPGDNVSYKRELLESAQDHYRDGFWEPVVHRRLAATGATLWHAPELVVRQGRSAGIVAFVRQRMRHGLAHGGQRGGRFGRARNVAGVLGAPLVVPLLTARVLGRVARARRLRARAVCVLPLIVLFNAAWAMGEACGHLTALRGRS